VGLVERLGDQVRLLHIKDGPISADKKAQQPVGQGRMPVSALLAASQSLELGVVEFDDYAGDIFQGIQQSLKFLEGINSGIAQA
jgi:hypothetical protein